MKPGLSPEGCKQSPRRPSIRERIRATVSSILLFNSDTRENSPVDPARAEDATHLNDVSLPRKVLRRLSQRLGLFFKRPKPVVGSPQSDFAHSINSDTQASISSDSSTESMKSTSRQTFGPYHILVRGNEHITPKEVWGMMAGLDTGSKVNLMSRHHFDRLQRAHNIQMYRARKDIVPLNGKQMKAHGIARGVLWQFGKGFKTYKSDFYILDMDQFDVLIGEKTISKYELLSPGADTQRHLRRTRENEERQQQERREITEVNYMVVA
ncbi:hypothetical protein BJX63DRAFT_244614 [Aspergillus granulosus]|uniref:Uncharacterized protein n=1 Tax=Aspergillus granulosus TaxID=176169 RepID=A0ABR4HAL0_9EURO